MTHKTLADAVKAKRRAEKLTLMEFGKRYNIAFKTVSKIENNKWQFSISYAQKVCDKLGIEMIIEYKNKKQ